MKFHLVIKKFKTDFTIYFLLGIISVILPSFILYFINSLIKSIVNKEEFSSYLIIVVISFFIMIICIYFRIYSRKRLLNKLIYYIREEKWNSLMDSTFNPRMQIKKTKNEIIKKITKSIEGATLGIFDIINNFVFLLSAFTVLFLFHWILGLVVFVAIVFVLCFIAMTKSHNSKYYKKIKKEYSEYNQKVREIIKWRNGLFLLQKINFFNNLIMKLTFSTNSSIYEIYKKTIYYSITVLSLGLIFQLSGPVISAILAYNGFVNVSVIAVSGFLIGIIYTSTTSFGLQTKNFLKSKEELNNLVFRKGTSRKKQFAISKIELIDFNPTTRDQPLLKENINMKLDINSKIHLTGSTPIGRSAIFKSLLSGKNFNGNVLINGKKAEGFMNYSKIILLNRTTHIFNASFRENVSLFSPKYTDSTIQKINEKIKLKIDLDKQISNSEVSEAQKQKISLVRALLMKPDFIFIDEGFSSITPQNREEIENFISTTDIGIILISNKKVGDGYEKKTIN